MIKDISYLNELEKQFVDPIAHFKAVAKQMTAERKRLKDTIQVIVPGHSTMACKDFTFLRIKTP